MRITKRMPSSAFQLLSPNVRASRQRDGCWRARASATSRPARSPRLRRAPPRQERGEPVGAPHQGGAGVERRLGQEEQEVVERHRGVHGQRGHGRQQREGDERLSRARRLPAAAAYAPAPRSPGRPAPRTRGRRRGSAGRTPAGRGPGQRALMTKLHWKNARTASCRRTRPARARSARTKPKRLRAHGPEPRPRAGRPGGATPASPARRAPRPGRRKRTFCVNRNVAPNRAPLSAKRPAAAGEPAARRRQPASAASSPATISAVAGTSGRTSSVLVRKIQVPPSSSGRRPRFARRPASAARAQT